MIVVTKPASARLGGPLDDIIAAGQNALTRAARDQIAKNVQSVTFLTEYSRPTVYSGQNIADMLPGAEASTGVGQRSILDRIKPTIVVQGTFGTKTFAPYGVANPANYGRNIGMLVFGTIGVLALFTAGGYYLGLKAGERRR